MTLWVGIIQKIEFLLSFKHFLWLFNEAFGLFWQPQNPTMPKTGVLGFALKCIGMYLVLTELTISYYLIWSIRTRYYSVFNMVKFIANNLKGQYLHNLLLPLWGNIVAFFIHFNSTSLSSPYCFNPFFLLTRYNKDWGHIFQIAIFLPAQRPQTCRPS